MIGLFLRTLCWAQLLAKLTCGKKPNMTNEPKYTEKDAYNGECCVPFDFRLTGQADIASDDSCQTKRETADSTK